MAGVFFHPNRTWLVLRAISSAPYRMSRDETKSHDTWARIGVRMPRRRSCFLFFFFFEYRFFSVFFVLTTRRAMLPLNSYNSDNDVLPRRRKTLLISFLPINVYRFTRTNNCGQTIFRSIVFPIFKYEILLYYYSTDVNWQI